MSKIMKVMKVIFLRALWLDRGTSTVLGLVIVSLTAGLASSALAANGNNFILGRSTNAATAITPRR